MRAVTAGTFPTVVLPIDLQLANVVPQHERGFFFSGKALQEEYCTASFRCISSISMCLNHQVRDASETTSPLTSVHIMEITPGEGVACLLDTHKTGPIDGHIQTLPS